MKGQMQEITPDDIIIRVMTEKDLDAIVKIDLDISGRNQAEYYREKIKALEDSGINTSLVAEVGGMVVGFIMGEVYYGEFGIPEPTALIDTLGVHPEYQKSGIASAMLEQFMTNVKAIKVELIHTLTNWNDWDSLKFFHRHGFKPSQRINLELYI